tara:strand:+ start:298 stop:468 length:171 start_codon:yes stop_codon:yes gene_type:complete
MLKLLNVVNITQAEILPLTDNPWKSESKPAGISVAPLDSSEGDFKYHSWLNDMYVA